jgi:hypothetical protein
MSTLKILADPGDVAKASDPKWYSTLTHFRSFS